MVSPIGNPQIGAPLERRIIRHISVPLELTFKELEAKTRHELAVLILFNGVRFVVRQKKRKSD